MRKRIARAIGGTMAFLELRTPVWRVFALSAAVMVVATVALLPFPAAANALTDGLAQVLGTILSFFVEILGKILLMAIYLLTWVASYN
ncbi:hypothetical protein HY480_03515, partial [Candidatus Uhrbacteria bacterium]|nr:hypothetical protein [Candidatus Uhrbacteria bacterium]